MRFVLVVTTMATIMVVGFGVAGETVYTNQKCKEGQYRCKQTCYPYQTGKWLKSPGVWSGSCRPEVGETCTWLDNLECVNTLYANSSCTGNPIAGGFTAYTSGCTAGLDPPPP
jgi:hypothetical protein